MNLFEKIGEEAAKKLTAEDVLPMQGWGPWWADYFGSSSGFNRAGRGRTIARALGDKKAPFSVERPVISALLANRLGTLLGGVAGWGIGGMTNSSNPLAAKVLGATIGSTVGEIGGQSLAAFFRRRRLGQLNQRLQKALDTEQPLNFDEKPPVGPANYVPYVGSGRLGAVEAYLQLKNKDKNKYNNNLVVPEELAHNLTPGILGSILQTMQGHKAKRLLEQDLKDSQS